MICSARSMSLKILVNEGVLSHEDLDDDLNNLIR